MKKAINVVTTYSEDKKLLKVTVNCKVPFKFFIYTTHEMKGNQIQNNLGSYFNKKIARNELHVEKLTKDIKEIENQIKSLKDNDIDKRNKLLMLEENLNNNTAKFNSSNDLLKQEDKKINEQITSVKKTYLKQIDQNKVIKNGVDIVKIFNENKLSSFTNESLKKLRAFIIEEDTHLKNFQLKMKTYEGNLKN